MIHRDRRSATWKTVPGELAVSEARSFAGDDVVLAVGLFRASDVGLFGRVSCLGTSGIEFDGLAGFGGPPAGPSPTDPCLWVEVGGEIILSEIQGGSTSLDESGVSAWDFEVWFPFDVTSMRDDVAMHVAWRRISAEPAVFTLSRDLIRGAASRSLTIDLA